MENKTRCIGIVGGMGPMAGVLLQQMIIKMTSAERDQDHLRVICYTNPQIPDRSQSLREDGGDAYVAGIIESINVLEKAGAELIAIPCNTSHARLEDIAQSVSVPVLNMIDATLCKVRSLGAERIGILATDGAIASGVFQKDASLSVIVPDAAAQREVMKVIYDIKAGNYNDAKTFAKIKELSTRLFDRGAQSVVLGCTELSLYASLFSEGEIIDPLTELSRAAVSMATSVPNAPQAVR
jgi:aspartate racemase